jgi:hypothetical protein
MSKKAKTPDETVKGKNRAYIQRQFEGWLRMVYPTHAIMPNIQRTALREAFYSGAACFNGLLMGTVSETDTIDDVTQEDYNLLADVQKELDDFSAGILARVKPDGR